MLQKVIIFSLSFMPVLSLNAEEILFLNNGDTLTGQIKEFRNQEILFAYQNSLVLIPLPILKKIHYRKSAESPFVPVTQALPEWLAAYQTAPSAGCSCAAINTPAAAQEVSSEKDTETGQTEFLFPNGDRISGQVLFTGEGFVLLKTSFGIYRFPVNSQKKAEVSGSP